AAADLAIERELPLGHSPRGLSLGPDQRTLYCCLQFEDRVVAVDLAEWQVTASYAAVREPTAIAYSAHHGGRLVVTNLLSDQAATAAWTGAVLSLIDPAGQAATVQVPLVDGSAGTQDVALSSDGRYAYVPTPIARHRVPATQIERGWIYTNGLGIVDLVDQRLLTTVLLDDPTRGAANPWQIATTATGVVISLAGTHELLYLDDRGLLAAVQALDEARRGTLDYDLGYTRPWKTRRALSARGPRALAVAGDAVYVAGYYSNGIVRAGLSSTTRHSDVVPQQEVSASRRGDFLFHDASYSFQQWMSCVSCHPGVRTDALNWDLGNDGFGSPRQVKSLLFSHPTPPTTITGCRPNAETSVRAGIRFLRGVLPETDAVALDAFLNDLRPVPSPHLPRSAQERAAVTRGWTLFHGKAACSHCHSGDYLTDQQLHDVGTSLPSDRYQAFDTPTLREVWRTAPYLNDGRAPTLRSIFTEHDPEGMHGNAASLDEDELDALLRYVRTL
ncbi:MAG: cell surface protein, partial [Planctomycetota bacterium]